MFHAAVLAYGWFQQEQCAGQCGDLEERVHQRKRGDTLGWRQWEALITVRGAARRHPEPFGHLTMFPLPPPIGVNILCFCNLCLFVLFRGLFKGWGTCCLIRRGLGSQGKGEVAVEVLPHGPVRPVLFLRGPGTRGSPSAQLRLFRLLKNPTALWGFPSPSAAPEAPWPPA